MKQRPAHLFDSIRLAREALDTPWIKLEVIADPQSLYPDNEETLEAAKILVKEGFTVLPYVNADPILARKLCDARCGADEECYFPSPDAPSCRKRETFDAGAAVPEAVAGAVGQPGLGGIPGGGRGHGVIHRWTTGSRRGRGQ